MGFLNRSSKLPRTTLLKSMFQTDTRTEMPSACPTVVPTDLPLLSIISLPTPSLSLLHFQPWIVSPLLHPCRADGSSPDSTPAAISPLKHQRPTTLSAVLIRSHFIIFVFYHSLVFSRSCLCFDGNIVRSRTLFFVSKHSCLDGPSDCPKGQNYVHACKQASEDS
jgi:hypothetical protein